MQIGVWYSNNTLAMNSTSLDINASETLANKTLTVTTILVRTSPVMTPMLRALNKNLLSISDQNVRDNVNYRAFTDLALTGTSIADSKVAKVFSNSTSPNPMRLECYYGRYKYL